MKKIVLGFIALALGTSLNSQPICRNYTDQNGDGVCDTCESSNHVTRCQQRKLNCYNQSYTPETTTTNSYNYGYGHENGSHCGNGSGHHHNH